MKRNLRGWRFLLLAAAGLMLALLAAPSLAAGRQVLVVEVTGEVDPGLAQYVQRAIRQAEADPNTAGILLEINTPGGLVTSAQEIKRAILGAGKPTVAWVKDEAWSAGALITMAADKVYMKPSSSIGAAEPRFLGGGTETDPKVVGALAAEFEAVAKARGRNADVARKMVDKGFRLEGFRDGELAVLDYQKAVALHVADGQAADRAAVLSAMGWGDAEVKLADAGPGGDLARFLVQPGVGALLLILGVAAIGFEFFHPGMTVPAVVGVLCLAAFFGSNVLLGNAPWWVMVLLFAGLGFLGVEAFIPGHGAMGLIGLGCVLGAVFLAVPNRTLGLFYMAGVCLAGMVMVVGVMTRISRRGMGRWLTNATVQTRAAGYVAPRATLAADLMGATGTTLTVLRPAGTAQFGERKLDVVSEGDYVDPGAQVVVMRVEGTRVIVRRV